MTNNDFIWINNFILFYCMSSKIYLLISSADVLKSSNPIFNVRCDEDSFKIKDFFFLILIFTTLFLVLDKYKNYSLIKKKLKRRGLKPTWKNTNSRL